MDNGLEEGMEHAMLVISHVIDTDLPTTMHYLRFYCSIHDIWRLATQFSSSQREGAKGYFASRNNGIMDNEDLPPSSILLENLDLKRECLYSWQLHTGLVAIIMQPIS